MTKSEVLSTLGQGEHLIAINYYGDGCVAYYSFSRIDGGISSFGLKHGCGK